MHYTLGLNKLPFERTPVQIIYVENDYDDKVNSYIQTNYHAIKKCFSRYGLDFCYLPLLSKELESEEVIKYYAPYETDSNKDTISPLSLRSDYLLQFMTNPENRNKVPPSLLYYNDFMLFPEDEAVDCYYRGMSLDIDTLEKCSNDFGRIVSDILWDISSCLPSDDGIRYSEGEPDETPDDRFDEETKQLIQEIKERVARLEQKGIGRFFIENQIRQEEKLSRIRITKDKRIFLLDYDNMEIEMAPLPKAVFFLFLRHPEGIVFKYLSDYRDELMELYQEIKPLHFFSFREKKSIEDVTSSSMKNSINEKCTRIKEAFIGKFDERIAHNYYIEGKRGEAKKIVLPRDLVIWEI